MSGLLPSTLGELKLNEPCEGSAADRVALLPESGTIVSGGAMLVEADEVVAESVFCCGSNGATLILSPESKSVVLVDCSELLSEEGMFTSAEAMSG